MKEDKIMVMMREFPETFLKRKVLHTLNNTYVSQGRREVQREGRKGGVEGVMGKDNERG